MVVQLPPTYESWVADNSTNILITAFVMRFGDSFPASDFLNSRISWGKDDPVAKFAMDVCLMFHKDFRLSNMSPEEYESFLGDTPQGAATLERMCSLMNDEVFQIASEFA